MMQNPTPSTGKTVSRKAMPTGAIKRDINLMPVNANSERIARSGTVVLFVLLGLLALAAVVIYLPLTQLNALQDKANAADNEVLSKAAVEMEFNNTIAQRNSLLDMLTNLENIKTSALHPSDIVDMLSVACPESITLTNIMITNGELTVSGKAPSDTDIAQFIVNLRTQPKTFGASLVGVKQDPDNAATQRRLFDITVRLVPMPTPAPTVDPAATPAPTAEGGDGK